MKTAILSYLKNTNGYISGEQLSKELGVSRTAIWKVINSLREEGYTIESVTRKGYHLVSNADRITAEEISLYNHAVWAGREVEYFEVTDSTNQRIHDFARNGRGNGLLAVCEEQTGGRGRRGRTWISPPGTGIWMSLLLRPKMEPQKASMVTIITALALTKAIDEMTTLSPQIKWPNDVIVNGKKVSGILTEMNADMDEIHYIVVGIGINANTKDFAPEISDMATSLYVESGQKIERAKLIAEFCQQFERLYEAFLLSGDLWKVKKEYESYLVNIGREVKIIKNREEKIRKAIGINELGELIVEDGSGKKEIVLSGEVSVRGLYGYV